MHPALTGHAEQLAVLHEELVRMHRLSTLGLAAGMIAHEFNNILTPLASYAQMALAEPDDRELATKVLQRCLLATEQTSRIASAILELVRSAGVSDGSNAAHAARANVHACLRTAIDCLGRSPEKDGIALTLPGEDAEIDAVHAAIEPHALTHALVNLLINSRNAIDRRGSIRIEVTRQPTPPVTAPDAEDSRCSTWNSGGEAAERSTPADSTHQGDWIIISIRDSGRGMSADQLAQIFAPPHLRTSSRGTRRGGPEHGTGLGMTITKQLIEHAGGWITVESALSQGTLARIVLPAGSAKTTK